MDGRSAPKTLVVATKPIAGRAARGARRGDAAEAGRKWQRGERQAREGTTAQGQGLQLTHDDGNLQPACMSQRQSLIANTMAPPTGCRPWPWARRPSHAPSLPCFGYPRARNGTPWRWHPSPP